MIHQGRAQSAADAFWICAPPTRRRRTPERIAQLHALGHEETIRTLAELLQRSPYYVNLNEFARDRALSPNAVDKLVEQLGAPRVNGSAAYVSRKSHGRIEDRIC